MANNNFVGAWRLLSIEVERSDGQLSPLSNRDATGYIIYSESGYMSAVIMQPNRSRFDAETLGEGSVAEKAAAAETYMSYCGKYGVRGNTVVHHVAASLFPNWVGEGLERNFEFDGNHLILSPAPRVVDGVQQTSRLTWERV